MTSDQRPTIKSPRGTRDLLPPETALWNFVEAAVRDVFRAYLEFELAAHLSWRDADAL